MDTAAGFTVKFHRATEAHDHDYYEACLQGSVTYNTIGEVIRAIRAQPDFDQQGYVLWDIRKCDPTGITFQETTNAVSVENRVHMHIKAAMLYETEFQLAIVRQVIYLASLIDLDRFLFTQDEAAARNWVS